MRFAPATTTTSRSRWDWVKLANLRHRTRERFFQPLDVLEDFGFFAVAEQSLDLVALLARELADFRDDDRDHRKFGVDMQRLEVLGANASRTSVIAGRRMSGLSIPYSRIAWS